MIVHGPEKRSAILDILGLTGDLNVKEIRVTEDAIIIERWLDKQPEPTTWLEDHED